MSLLEGVVALVVLGLSIGGFLDVFRSGATAATRAESASAVVAAATSAIEAASLGDALQAQEALGPERQDVARRVVAQPWDGAPGITEVVVVVTPREGAPFEVRRLVRDPRGLQRPLP